ncbi:MAG: hypothetical protein GXX95_03740 [Methanomassiliicoccus sp.]|jgi:hypothetical protein|nr:hypothetical protein [Methanomassiliicoccus sp.]
MPDVKDVCQGPPRLSREDRDKIVSRIHSLLFWVGEVIPQDIVVGDRKVNLRDIVFDYIVRDSHTEEERREAETLARLLDDKIKEMEREIKHGDVTRAKACGLMNEARSLMRAVDELRSTSEKDDQIKYRELMGKVEDAKRWQEFLKEVR